MSPVRDVALDRGLDRWICWIKLDKLDELDASPNFSAMSPARDVALDRAAFAGLLTCEV
jgi:hypothetical protein